MDYTGNSLVSVLGKNINSIDFGQFKSFWYLNNRYENSDRGIRLILNPATQTVDTILIAGYDFKVNGVPYAYCSTKLPFDIKLTDNLNSVSQKTGVEAQKNGTVLRYDINSCGMYVNYTADNKIQWMKFFINRVKSTATAGVAEKPRIKYGGDQGGGYVVKVTAFKKAVMGVFESWRESALTSVKQSVRGNGNFWNYKYTYATSLKIPGEQYNMLYSFPFEASQLDFVSVIKESDSYDASFETVYKDFEKKLMDNFPAKEGWVASCLPNAEGKKLSNFEVRNEKYGSIILDYTKSPKGKHVLYLRFLLYS